MTHICVSKLTIIGSDNGLSPGRRQTIILTNAGILLIGPLRTNFSGILIKIQTFSFKKMRLIVSSAKRWPFCLGRVYGFPCYHDWRWMCEASWNNDDMQNHHILMPFLSRWNDQTWYKIKNDPFPQNFIPNIKPYCSINFHERHYKSCASVPLCNKHHINSRWRFNFRTYDRHCWNINLVMTVIGAVLAQFRL